MSDFNFWIILMLDGAANGCIYGLLALSIVLMYRSSKLFNFSLASVSTFLMIIAASGLKKFSMPSIFIMALLAGSLVGILLHVGVMRPITENRKSSHVTEVLAIFALMAIFDGLSSFIFGETPVAFPSLFPDGNIKFANFNFSFSSLGIVGASIVVIAFVALFFRYTTIGLLMEAVAEDSTAARLRGIRASNVLAIAWGVTGAMGMMATLLIAPLVFVYPGMLGPVFGYSLISVIIGGLESPVGAVVGGGIVGIVENLAGNIAWIGPELKFLAVFFLLVLILIFRPRGLFGRADLRRI